MPIETEIKVRLKGEIETTARTLRELGHDGGPRDLEINQVYDLPRGVLRASGRLLRLRSAGGVWTLTYKGPGSSGRYKSREEIETRVEDGDALHAILRALSYEPTFRYEKHRTAFHREGAAGEVTLDETPIGVFLELEGEPDWIDATAQQLGYKPADYITASYATLYREFREGHPEVPADMKF